MRLSSMIRVKRQPQVKWLVGLLIIWPFLFGLLNELLGLPWAIRYAMDAGWMMLLVMMLLNKKMFRKNVKCFIIWLVMFGLYTLAVYLLRYQSVAYYLWGIRNCFRMYAAFFAFAVFLTPTEAGSYLNLFEKLFWINVVVCLVQFLGFRLNQDFLGGLFGTAGTNGYTNIFMLIILIKSVLYYLEKREDLLPCAAKCVAAFLMAALAELKFFFIEACLVIGLAVLITRFTWRKALMVIGGILAIIVGIQLLELIFPFFSGWFSVESILETVTANKGYTYSGDLNRLTAIPRINELWLRDPMERLFGLGLGNCDTASYELLNTPFYREYGDMHYTWISYAMMYLECGWIGLLFYEAFFGMVFLYSWVVSKENKGPEGTYARMAMIFSVMCVLISIYNSSLRTEAGYMAFFVLALPFMRNRDEDEDPDRKTEITCCR